MGKKIKKDEADRIIKEQLESGRPHRKVVICYAGQWYDIRHLDEEEIRIFINLLIK